MKFADVTKDSSSSTTTHLACSEALFDGSVASARADHRRFRGFDCQANHFPRTTLRRNESARSRSVHRRLARDIEKRLDPKPG